jgi:hypothetical protein
MSASFRMRRRFLILMPPRQRMLAFRFLGAKAGEKP